MIIVVDSNTLFSACISPNNKIAEILFSPHPKLATHLKVSGFEKVINTSELYEVLAIG